MITEQLLLKCQRKIPEVLRSAITNKELFPWEVAISKNYLVNNLAVWTSEVEALKHIDKTITGSGPRVIYQEKNSRLFGKQPFPSKIVFETSADFLEYTSTVSQWNLITTISNKLKNRIPTLNEWLKKPSSFKRLLDHREKWDELMEVCLYFIERDSSIESFAREAQLKVPTKFIEENKGILKELLDAVLPADKIKADSSDFYERFKLKTDQTRVRIRILDDDIKLLFFASTYVSDIEIPLKEMDYLLCTKPLSEIRVFVVENLTTFLSFPNLPKSLVVLGGGFFAGAIDLKSFRETPLFYWGDLDVQGLEILAIFRRKYPHVKSVLMNNQTLIDHFEFCWKGEPSNFLTMPEGLLDEECLIYSHLKNHNIRLEQERISASYASFELSAL